MRDSADSDDPAFGRIRKANNKRQRNRFNDEDTFAKRDRHVERLASVDTAADQTDGLAPGERWSTWDQTQNLISSEVGSVERVGDPDARVVLAIP